MPQVSILRPGRAGHRVGQESGFACSTAQYTLSAMTRGLHRFQQTSGMHFLTFSCHRRQPHLGTGGARDIFESALERVRRRYDFVVAGYVVMPEHVHLLMSAPLTGTVAGAVQALKLSVARR